MKPVAVWVGISLVGLLVAVWWGYVTRLRLERGRNDQHDTGAAGVGSAFGATVAAAERPGHPAGRGDRCPISCATCWHVHTSLDDAPCRGCNRFEAWEVAPPPQPDGGVIEAGPLEDCHGMVAGPVPILHRHDPAEALGTIRTETPGSITFVPETPELIERLRALAMEWQARAGRLEAHRNERFHAFGAQLQECAEDLLEALRTDGVEARTNDLTHRSICTAAWEVPAMPWTLRDGQTVVARDMGLFDLSQPGYGTLHDLTVHQVLDVLRQRNAGVSASRHQTFSQETPS